MSIRKLMIQATPICNMNCSYCYIPEENRQQKGRISDETLTAIYEKILTSFLISKDLTILWHAGEPLMLPVSFYEQVFNDVNKYKQVGQTITQCIQSNATLINDQWCELFNAYNVYLGISVDGPKFLHDRFRRYWSGKPTHDLISKNLKLLNHYDVPYYGLCTLTNESLDYPDELF